MNFKLKEDGLLFGSEAKSAQVFKADIPPVSVDVNCMNVVEDLKSQADITPVSEANSDNVNDADQVYEIQNIKRVNIRGVLDSYGISIYSSEVGSEEASDAYDVYPSMNKRAKCNRY